MQLKKNYSFGHYIFMKVIKNGTLRMYKKSWCVRLWQEGDCLREEGILSAMSSFTDNLKHWLV